MGEFSNDNQPKVAKFNSGLAILFRIDNLWKDAHAHSRRGELMKWNWDLDRVWCELASDASEETDTEFEKFSKDVNDAYKEKGDLKVKQSKLYKLLLRKEIYLRKLQNKQGKGMAYEEALDDYMD